jgi:hypothetical protein
MRDASLFRRSDLLAWLIVNPIQRVLAVWSLGFLFATREKATKWDVTPLPTWP